MANKLIDTDIKIGKGVLLDEAVQEFIDMKSIAWDSNDWSTWKDKPNGDYYIGGSGITRGYPHDYFYVNHAVVYRGFSNAIVYQMGFTTQSNVLYIRAFNSAQNTIWRAT